MSARTDLITKHTADMSAVLKHILEAVSKQREDESVRSMTDANRVIIEAERVLKQHVASLETLAQTYGAEGEAGFKKTVMAALGVVAGLYDKVRESSVTRMLRDDYAALSLTAMGYTTFHAFGLGIGEQKIADLAGQNLKDITPLLVEISRIIPATTIQELAKENPDIQVNMSAISEAVQNTQRAWERDVTESLN